MKSPSWRTFWIACFSLLWHDSAFQALAQPQNHHYVTIYIAPIGHGASIFPHFPIERWTWKTKTELSIHLATWDSRWIVVQRWMRKSSKNLDHILEDLCLYCFRDNEIISKPRAMKIILILGAKIEISETFYALKFKIPFYFWRQNSNWVEIWISSKFNFWTKNWVLHQCVLLISTL